MRRVADLRYSSHSLVGDRCEGLNRFDAGLLQERTQASLEIVIVESIVGYRYGLAGEVPF